MDPQTCLEWMLRAIAAGDVDTAAEHYNNLREWIRRGGYVPATLEELATDLHSIGQHTAGDDSDDAIDVRIYLGCSSPTVRMSYGDPSFDTDHRGYCGAAGYDSARGFSGAVDTILDAIDDALDVFAMSTDFR